MIAPLCDLKERWPKVRPKHGSRNKDLQQAPGGAAYSTEPDTELESPQTSDPQLEVRTGFAKVAQAVFRGSSQIWKALLRC